MKTRGEDQRLVCSWTLQYTLSRGMSLSRAPQKKKKKEEEEEEEESHGSLTKETRVCNGFATMILCL